MKAEDERRYDDIIDLPHPVSRTHPRMPAANRAAQFLPFAALSGYGDVIDETARLTDRRIELSESEKAELNARLSRLAERLPAAARLSSSQSAIGANVPPRRYISIQLELVQAPSAITRSIR